jgi:hypothetical protein
MHSPVAQRSRVGEAKATHLREQHTTLPKNHTLINTFFISLSLSLSYHFLSLFFKIKMRMRNGPELREVTEVLMCGYYSEISQPQKN